MAGFSTLDADRAGFYDALARALAQVDAAARVLMISTHEAAPAQPRAGSGEMFDRIAPRYDLLNRLISLGIDQRWRRQTVHSLRLSEQAKVLDVATGTADLALLIAHLHSNVTVVGLDPSGCMLQIGQQKVDRASLSQRITLQQGDAQAIPFADQSFQAVSMAFGIRNVPDRAQALREMYRVLSPGGRIAILELSEPPPGLMGSMARLHVHHVVPWLGGLISGVREYRYLQQSIAAFPPAPEFCALMKGAGFSEVHALPLTFAVCHLYVGAKPV